MCGRYTLRTPARDLKEHFGIDDLSEELAPRYNIAPSQPVWMIVGESPRRLREARWGLVPHWARDASIGARLINARAETLGEKPAFRDAFRERRCLIPADGFYEWRREGKRKIPVHIRRRDGAPFAFAGLWARWRDPAGQPLESCTIVTTRPNDLVAPIHDRMPVILPPADYGVWLAAREADASAATELLRPYPSPDLEAVDVSRAVNDTKNDGPECLEPPRTDNGPLFAIPRNKS
jgi:putative SOS response-associated peptidase YedK